MPALTPGQVIAHYEIRTLLGAGGMGEVYLAWDTRLQRDVALKVVTGGEGVEREARAASAMNHPNAAHIYEIGAHPGPQGDLVYIAMEHVAGITLEKRLEAGPLPVAEVMEIAIQLADALGEAAEKGIVHRDLKPGNIVLNPRGQAKILDFGIAKRTTAEALAEARTEPNAVQGTLPYMSPEQVRGAVVDPRSDQFSLGVVLYEMVAGKRPFDGDSLLESVNNIVKTPAPDINREDLPQALREVIFRCLEKEPSKRFASPREIVAELRSDRAVASRTEAPPRRPVQNWAIPVIALIGVVVFLLTRNREPAPAAAPAPQRLIKITSAPGLEDEPALSPDGRSVAYASDAHGNLDIFVVRIAGGEPVRITDDEADDAQPAWSPDGTRIAFVSARERGRRLSIVLSQALGNFVNANGGDLFVVPAAGGPPTKLIENAFYPAFSPDGKWIVFQSSRGGRWDLWKMPAAGGEPVQLTRDDEFDYHPSWSPDGRTIVYASGQPGPYRLRLIPASGGKPRLITDAEDRVILKPAFAGDSTSVIYASMRGGSLNLWRLALADGAKPERVTLGEGDDVHPSAGAGGRRIVYATVRQTPDLWSLDIASGKAEPLTFETGHEEYPHRSRDGRIVFASNRGGADALWLRDAHGKLLQFAARPFIGQPRWSPDGARIAYRVADRNVTSIAVQEVAGTGVRIVARLAETPSWSPDGRQLTYTAWTDARPKGQIHIANADGSAARRLTSLDLTTSYPTFSPDGKWISFQATRDDGTRHVWIVEVATGRTRRLTDGASEDSHPQWSPVDGDRILFIRNHENLMTVSVATGEVRALTRHSEPNMVLDYPSWSPDGTRVEYSIARKRGDIYMLE